MHRPCPTADNICKGPISGTINNLFKGSSDIFVYEALMIFSTLISEIVGDVSINGKSKDG